MKLPIYNIEGQETKKIDLLDEVFGLEWNADLVHQVVTAILGNQRENISHTKSKGEVAGGGKKPWRQKGTGRARHGSIRSPLWRGGGVTFGPRNDRNFNRKINKKMKAKSLAVVLSQKIRDGELILLDEVKTEEPKTTFAKKIINSIAKITGFEQIATKRKNTAVIGLSEIDINLAKSFRNLNNLFVEEVRNFNPALLLQYKYIVILDAENSIKILEERLKTDNK